MDTLTYQIQELERAGLKPGEDEELDARKTLMRSAGKLMDALQAAEYALGGDEDSQGACALIADAEGELRGVARLSPQIGALADQVSTLRAAAEDALESLRDQGRELDFSPEELDRLESRLDILYRLKKKYGSTVADMLDYLERSRQELDQIQDADDTIARLQKELSQVRHRPGRRESACPMPEKRRPCPCSSGCRRSCASWICRKCSSRLNFWGSRRRTGWDPQGWTKFSS